MSKQNNLTDNFKANLFLSPFICFAYFSFYDFLKLDNSERGFNTFHFLIVYIVASRFYSPDLDHRDNRPGKAHFPFGKILCENLLYKIGPLRIIQRFISKIWYLLWEPIGILLTHRGLIHWPIIGTIVKNSYIYLILVFVFGFKYSNQLNSFYHSGFDPHSMYFKMYFLPIYVADLTHILVDYYDSKKQGYSFCPPKIPRGLISKVIGITI